MPSIHRARLRSIAQHVGASRTILLVLAAAASTSGCGAVDGWRQSWRTARMPDRHLRLAGAQIPVELVEGWATRCRSVPFKVERVGKIRFSHDGFRALVAGQANVACTSARFPWYEARDYLNAYGHLPRGWRIAWSAYAVYVHPDNPVRQLTIKQFKQILRREITSWVSVDGPREPINLYGPPRSSRAGSVFMQVAKLTFADPPWKQLATPGDVIDAVRADPLAIGLTDVGHAEHAPYLALKGVIDTVARVPDARTLEADQWPLAKTIWLWTADPPDQAVADLIDYLYSDPGQADVKRRRYIPIPRDRGAVRMELKDLPETQPADPS